jgi:hypothetical protein
MEGSYKVHEEEPINYVEFDASNTWKILKQQRA